MDSSAVVGSLDAATDAVAVLDADGVVRYRNDRWTVLDHFGVDADVGTEYASALTDAGPAGTRVGEAVGAVVSGEPEATVEYECERSETRRWFRARAVGYEADGSRYVRVSHADVTDQVVAERAVRERDEALWASAAVLNHDLRNRFTVARGWLEMIGEDAGDARDRIENAVDRADDAIVDTVAYLRVGREGIPDDAVDLSGAAADAWNALADTAAADFEIREPGTTRGDAGLVTDAFRRLFDNAVTHAGADVSIVVDGFERDGATGFYVADDGPGIEEGDREAVLTLGGTTVEGGTGYGLPTVSRIAARHGWDVSVEESTLGGARVEFVTRPRVPNVRNEHPDPRLS